MEHLLLVIGWSPGTLEWKLFGWELAPIGGVGRGDRGRGSADRRRGSADRGRGSAVVQPSPFSTLPHRSDLLSNSGWPCPDLVTGSKTGSRMGPCRGTGSVADPAWGAAGWADLSEGISTWSSRIAVLQLEVAEVSASSSILHSHKHGTVINQLGGQEQQENGDKKNYLLFYWAVIIRFLNNNKDLFIKKEEHLLIRFSIIHGWLSCWFSVACCCSADLVPCQRIC